VSQNKTMGFSLGILLVAALATPSSFAVGLMTPTSADNFLGRPTEEAVLSSQQMQYKAQDAAAAAAAAAMQQAQIDQQAAEQKRLQDEAQKQQMMAMMGPAMASLGQMGGMVGSGKIPGAQSGSVGRYGGNDYGDNGYMSTRPESKCEGVAMSELTKQMLTDYKSCSDANNLSPSVMEGRRPIVINTDEKIGYMLDSGLNPIKCFTVTLGKRGVVPAGTGGPNNKATETGFFYTQIQNGDSYQSSNPDYEKKGISMGIDTGKVLHSDHENNTTIGCIGIEQAKWKEVFDDNIMGSPTFVWSERYQYSRDKRICNGAGGRKQSPGPSGTQKGYR
jgi:hypothetical protein